MGEALPTFLDTSSWNGTQLHRQIYIETFAFNKTNLNCEGTQEMQIKFYKELAIVTLIYERKSRVLTNSIKAE